MDDFRADLEMNLDIWMILAGELKLPLTIVIYSIKIQVRGAVVKKPTS